MNISPSPHPPTPPPAVLSRIKSTTGINKITKTMKMVSASKMRGDEDRLKNGRPFQVRPGVCYNQ